MDYETLKQAEARRWGEFRVALHNEMQKLPEYNPRDTVQQLIRGHLVTLAALIKLMEER